MYAIVASHEYKQLIKAAIGAQSIVVFENYGVVNIKKIISEISRLKISTLILQSSVADANEISEAVKSLKVIRPHVRVIFISPESKPGELLIANLISKGVYDIYCPSIDKKAREVVVELQSIIYGDPANYADVVRWDVPATKEMCRNITAIPVKTALVVNTSKCAGSTFLATALAGVISKYPVIPAVVEFPTEPYLFDALGLALLDHNDSSFYSYPHIIKNKITIETGRETISDDIIWLVPDSRLETITDWNYSDMIRLLYCCKQAGVIIVDGGSNINEDCVESLLPIVDVVFAIIDPLPIQIIKAENNVQKLIELQRKGVKVVFVANKWSKGLKKTDFIKLVNVKPQAFIPLVDQTNMYKAAYSCQIQYSVPEVQDKLENSLHTLIKELLPTSVITKANKKRKGIFNKKRRR